jgi:hypothetical protein
MHRAQVQTADGISLLAALWLFISTFATYPHDWMMISNALATLGVAVIAVNQMSWGYDRSWLGWVNVPLGAWMVVSPWAVMGTSPADAIVLNNCIAGGVIIVAAVWSAVATDPEAGAAFDARHSLSH